MRIGNYIFYPAFFIIFIFIPTILTVGVLFLRDLIKSSKHKKINCINKKHIVITKKYLQENKYYEELLYYLQENKEYYPQATLQYGDDFVSTICKDLIRVIISNTENKKLCVDILIFIDKLNSLLVQEKGRVVWLGDDIEKATYYMDMEENQSKLEHIYISSITSKLALIEPYQTMFNENLNIIEGLRKYTIYDIEALTNKLIESKNMYLLEDDVKTLVRLCLLDEVIDIINIFEKGLLNSSRIYKVRALACIMAEKNYEDLLKKKY